MLSRSIERLSEMNRVITSDSLQRALIPITSLNIVGNIWNNVSTELNIIHNKGIVVFRYFKVEKVLCTFKRTH